MSRSLTFCSCLTVMLATTVSAAACSSEDQYKLRQPITMGPWTFQVERATERVDTRGVLRPKVISVDFKLENYMERHEIPFDDFMSGHREGSIIAHPHLVLVDAAGHRFDLEALSPLSGGSLRSEEWRARFPLIELSLRESSSETAAEHIDKHPADFRLVIENPDQQSGQPHKVSIQLE